MTDCIATRMHLWQLLSEEADDFEIHLITREQELLRDLHLSGIQRVALCYRIEAEFEIELDDAAWNRLTHPTATVCDVLNAVERLPPTSMKAST